MKWMPHITSAVSGIIIWVGVGVVTDNYEAWDNALYWRVGIPILAIVTFIIGFLESKTPYLWGIIQGLSQSATILLQGLYFGYSLNLYPPSIVFNIIISAPSILSAYLAVIICNFVKRQRT